MMSNGNSAGRISGSDGRHTLGRWLVSLISAMAAMLLAAPAMAVAPTISGTPATSVTVGSVYSFTPIASHSSGQKIFFDIVNKPSWASFNKTTGTLSGTPAAANVGTYKNITIYAAISSGESSNLKFTLTVKAVSVPTNAPPIISGAPATSVTVGGAYNFTPTASDPDGDTLAFSISNKPLWASFATANGGLSGTPTAADVGSYDNIGITATDSNGASQSLTSFTITVEAAPVPTNTPPTISGTPAPSITEGSAYSFTPTAADPDGDVLAFSISNKPSWATFSTINGNLSGTPTAADVGSYGDIGITVTDSKGASQLLTPFTITVAEVAEPPPPVDGYAFISNETGTKRVVSYKVGASGGLTQISALSVGAPVTGVAVTPSGKHVIVAADLSNTADGGLRVYSVGSTGQLAFVSDVPMGPGTGGYSHTTGCGKRPGNSGDISCGIGINSAPETVLIHPNGRFVYVMDGVADGACSPAGVNPCTPENGGFPAAGNRVIVRYTFDPATGKLTYQDQHYVEGFMSFAMDPKGRFVWGTSYLEKRIYEFRIDQTTGALTFGTGTYIGMTNSSMWFGIDPNGNYAYVAHVGDKTIDGYTINQTTGHLTNIGSINGSCSAAGANCNKATNVVARGLAVSANGRTLYAALGSGGVAAYALGTDGRIGAPVAGSPFWPSVLLGSVSRALLATGSAGQYLYLQSYSGAARVFSINSSTGVLTETSASPISLVGGTSGVTGIAVQ